MSDPTPLLIWCAECDHGQPIHVGPADAIPDEALSDPIHPEEADAEEREVKCPGCGSRNLTVNVETGIIA